MPDSINMESIAYRLDNHIQKCEASNTVAAEAMVKLSDNVETVANKVIEIEKLPMKAVRWIGLAIAGAAVSIVVQNFYLHEQTDSKAAVAAQQATATEATQGVVIDKLTKLQAATGAEK